MAVFRAFKPEAMNKIAKSMGYSGDMGQFQDFIEQDPARQARMEQFEDAADRQGCVDRNVEHLELMKAKDDWGSEDMAATTKAITDGKAYKAS